MPRSFSDAAWIPEAERPLPHRPDCPCERCLPLTELHTVESPCAACATEPAMDLREDDVLILPNGEALTAARMRRGAAMQEIARLVALYRRDHRGATEAEAQHRVLETHPQLRADYAAVPPSLEDHLRKAPPGAAVVAETGGGHRYVVSGSPARAYGGVNRSDLLAPGDGVRVTWAYSPVVGDQVPQRIRFSKVQFPHRGRVDVWLKERGLVPVAVEELFDAFVATLPDPGQQRAEGSTRGGPRPFARYGDRGLPADLREAIRARKDAAPREVLLGLLADATHRQQMVDFLLERFPELLEE
jgi:hypothetical protein